MKAVHVILFLLISLFIVESYAISSDHLEKLRARTGGLSHREAWAKKLDKMEAQWHSKLQESATKAGGVSDKVAANFESLLKEKKREL